MTDNMNKNVYVSACDLKQKIKKNILYKRKKSEKDNFQEFVYRYIDWYDMYGMYYILKNRFVFYLCTYVFMFRCCYTYENICLKWGKFNCRRL